MKKCETCGKEMTLKETKVVANTSYNLWFCPKCKKAVAKSG